MKKKQYESPQADVASIENMQIICTSTTVEQEDLEGYTEFEWAESSKEEFEW